MNNFEHQERIVRAQWTVTTAVIALGVWVYVLFFGPLSGRYISRALDLSVNLELVQQTEGVYEERIPLENSELKLSLVLETPRYLRVNTPVRIRVKRGSLTLVKHEKLSILSFPAPGNPEKPWIWMRIYVNPEKFAAPTITSESGTKIPLKEALEWEEEYEGYFDLGAAETSTVYHWSGPKFFLFHIGIPRGEGSRRDTWIEGKTGNLFEVEPDSISINLLISKIILTLTLLGAIIFFGEFGVHLYALRSARRKTKSD